MCVIAALCSSVSLPNGCGGVFLKREEREESAGREQLRHSRWKQVS